MSFSRPSGRVSAQSARVGGDPEKVGLDVGLAVFIGVLTPGLELPPRAGHVGIQTLIGVTAEVGHYVVELGSGPSTGHDAEPTR
jgi:hypothetical protein